ncbi:DNA polymerase III subunit beta [Tateyamaria sp. syn59]|uniref:DNA polymerase III subunit beta n=1 Tax=Tateyamaria sp. syn59 TaxID=2576942 RepID=UPI0011BE3CEC|nr:DNA polymerase III subunit beta [Tateyamaria sp. syn59]
MRFDVEISDLTPAVQFAASVVARRSTSPIMESIRIEASDNALVLSGSDHDVHTRARCEAAVFQSGSLCVHANDLLQLLKHLGDEAVKFEAIEDGEFPLLRIQAGGTSVDFPTLASEHFPRAEKPDQETEIIGGAAAFLQCASFANEDDSRTALHGVAFANGLAFGTDGYMFFGCPCENEANKIVPASASSVVKRLNGGRFFLSSQAWRLETANFSAIGRLIDAEPVDIGNLVGGYGDAFTSVDADGLLHAVKTVTFGRARVAYFEAKDDCYSVQGDGFEGRHISGGARVPAQGEPRSMVLATKYVLPALSALAGRVVDVSTDGNGVRFASDGTFAMVMPIRDSRHALSAGPS